MKIAPALALSIAAAMSLPLQASADEILDYTSSILFGTSTQLPASQNGLVDPGTLKPVSTLGVMTAEFDFTGSLAQNNLQLAGYSINVTARDGHTSVLFNDIDPDFLAGAKSASELSYCNATSFSASGCMNFSAHNNRLTGGTIDLLSAFNGKTSGAGVSIGTGGASFSYGGVSGEGCVSPDPTQAVFHGPKNKVLCTLDIKSGKPGSWSEHAKSAPEVDPGFIQSGVPLLASVLVLLTTRRRGARVRA